MRAWILAGIVACQPSVPEVCERMCAVAVDAQAACLERDGLSWDATTWGSAQGFAESCDTWAWELARLARDARRRGVPRSDTSVAGICETRAEELAADGCDAWEAQVWDVPPWE